MQVEVLCFAQTQDAVGTARLVLQVRDGTTTGVLLDQLLDEYPALRPARASLRLAVNEEFAPLDRALAEGDTVALLPPVSGG